MLLGLSGLPAAVRGAEPPCPSSRPDTDATTTTERPTPPVPRAQVDQADIEFSSDKATVGTDGNAQLSGNVVVRQGDREIRANNVEYNQSENAFKVEGNVEFEDPLVRVRGGGGHYSATQGADFRDAEFELRERSARGSAAQMQLTPEGVMNLSAVSFTTCPVDDVSWQLRANSISLDTRTRIGTGRGTRVDFKGVPILYLPWMSFPLGDERKSGFLFPTIGHSSRGGVQAAVPFYWNIAPNADATLQATEYSRRGLDMGGEFRWLTERTLSKLEVNYLPNDSITHADRNRFKLDNVTKLPADLRFYVDAESVSDSKYFEDFAQGPEGTSIAFLERLAGLGYRDEHWRMSLEAQQWQTIDQNLAPADRPYARLPRLVLGADYGYGPGQLVRYGFDSEIVNFDRHVDPTVSQFDALRVHGWRFDAMPTASLDFETPGFFLRPGVAWRYTQYELSDGAPGQRSAPSRSLPIFSFDTGMMFERESGSRGQRRQTLEPRLLYLRVPFRQQDDLPLFDTGLPDLNLVQLFRTNRYVGADRVSDANQVSVGVTSRLFDSKSGTQFLAATVGQTYYFQNPRVHLPDEPVRDSNTSDFVGELLVTAYKNWNATLGIQWNPEEDRSERAQAMLQFKPGPEQVLNVGYRFQRGLLEQAEVSGAWPINRQFAGFARYVYSLQDHKALEQFAGVEYSACCWRLRLLGRKSVSTRDGSQDTGVYLQLELTGLASVGSAADALVAGAIRGYTRPATRP
ncbi:MAG TPA: LPS assembly protein LptD [Steroidobacteraceae bacterium]|nr:LPS assembly protein LptD [Steroidobacteraceae bacterium]